MVEIERTKERRIFLCDSPNLKYYIIVPLVKQVKVLLGFIEGVDDTKIKDIPVFNDKVVVVPVLNIQMTEYLKKTGISYTADALKYFKYLKDVVFNSLRNIHMDVDSVMIVNNSEQFASFNSYFVKTYNEEMQISDKDLLKKEVVTNTFAEEEMNKDLFASDTNVSGAVKDDVYKMEENLTDAHVKKLTKSKEPGFVSYVLLGVLVAVMTLVILYMLI